MSTDPSDLGFWFITLLIVFGVIFAVFFLCFIADLLLYSLGYRGKGLLDILGDAVYRVTEDGEEFLYHFVYSKAKYLYPILGALTVVGLPLWLSGLRLFSKIGEHMFGVGLVGLTIVTLGLIMYFDFRSANKRRDD